MTLAQLSPGQRRRVRRLALSDPLRRRLLELGLTPGAVVTGQRGVGRTGAVIFSLRGCRFCLRRPDARQIVLEDAP